MDNSKPVRNSHAPQAGSKDYAELLKLFERYYWTNKQLMKKKKQADHELDILLRDLTSDIRKNKRHAEGGERINSGLLYMESDESNIDGDN